MQVKILINDVFGRFIIGEIGEILKNDSDKYDCYVKLKGKIKLPDFLGGAFCDRCFYFYKNEVKILD